MDSLPRRAVGIYRDKGAIQLTRKALRSLRRRGSLLYWHSRGTRTFEIDGVEATFVTRGNVARSLQIFDEGEREMVRDLLRELRDDDVFWDVGAHIGFHSCFAAQRADRVEAFEPVPLSTKRLRENARKNGVDIGVHECALWDSNETLTLDDESASTGETGAITVPARRGDEFATDVSPPTVVKIDVEGAEPRVVEGMKDLLSADRCRVVYCEVHRPADGRSSITDHGSSAEEFLESLADLGFSVDVIEDRGLDFHVKATSD